MIEHTCAPRKPRSGRGRGGRERERRKSEVESGRPPLLAEPKTRRLEAQYANDDFKTGYLRSPRIARHTRGPTIRLLRVTAALSVSLDPRVEPTHPSTRKEKKNKKEPSHL